MYYKTRAELQLVREHIYIPVSEPDQSYKYIYILPDVQNDSEITPCFWFYS